MWIFGAISIIAATVFGSYVYLSRNFDYWKKRKVPHVNPIVLFGNLLDVVLGRDTPGSYLAKLYKRFEGPYFGFFGMDEPFLVIKDPDIIKRVLIGDFTSFSEKCYFNDEKIDPVFANTLFSSKMPIWNYLRFKLSSAFAIGKIKAMCPLTVKCGEAMCDYLYTKIGSEVDTKELAAKYTNDVIATCVFGVESNSFLNENNIFRIQSRKFFPETFARSIQSIAYVVGHTLVKVLKLKFIEPEAAEFFQDVFAQSLKYRENGGRYRNDFIDTLILLKNEESSNSKLKLETVLAQAVTFYVAGSETTSSGISYALLELAAHPYLQDKLQKEINEIISKYGEINYDAIKEMKYLDMVVCETLRKYPITPFLHRRCTERYTIAETGMELNPGLGILVPLTGLHSDPKYFPEPEKFNPERFNESNKSNILRYTYLPFGVGPRKCIGDTISLLNFKVAIVKILTHFKVDKANNTKYPLALGRSFISQPVGGVPLFFKKLTDTII